MEPVTAPCSERISLHSRAHSTRRRGVHGFRPKVSSGVRGLSVLTATSHAPQHGEHEHDDDHHDENPYQQVHSRVVTGRIRGVKHVEKPPSNPQPISLSNLPESITTPGDHPATGSVDRVGIAGRRPDDHDRQRTCEGTLATPPSRAVPRSRSTKHRDSPKAALFALDDHIRVAYEIRPPDR